jgi:hypothetical protein
LRKVYLIHRGFSRQICPAAHIPTHCATRSPRWFAAGGSTYSDSDSPGCAPAQGYAECERVHQRLPPLHQLCPAEAEAIQEVHRRRTIWLPPTPTCHRASGPLHTVHLLACSLALVERRRAQATGGSQPLS